MSRLFLPFLAALAAAAGPAKAQDAPIGLPKGAVETARMVEDGTRYRLPTARFTPSLRPGLDLEGALRLISWRAPWETGSSLPLFAALREDISSRGFRILHDCSTAGCGGYDFVYQTRLLPPPHMAVDLGDFHFLSARKENGPHIGLLVSANGAHAYVQLAELRAGLGDAALAAQKAPGDSLATRLARDGRAVLQGVSFGAGSTELANGPMPVLEEVAALMAAEPERRYLIVGHSDSLGSLEANRRVSRARAAAVRRALIADHGVDGARLSAVGAGPVAPLAANDTEAARAENRRVEIVAR